MYTATAIIYCNLQILKQLQYCKKRFTSSWVHAHLEDSPLLNVMWLRIAYFGIEWGFHSTVEPLYNEVLGITNNFHYHSNSEIHGKKKLDKTKPPYRGHVQLSVSWLFVISRFHCISKNFQSTLYSPRELLQRPKGTFGHKYCRLVCWDQRRA